MSATAASPPFTRSSAVSDQDRFGPLASIRTKVYASFACALVLMAILGAFAIYSLVHVNTLAGSIYRNGVVPVETLGQMHAGAGLLNLAVAESLADPGAIRSYATEAGQISADIERREGIYALSGLTGAERSELARYHADWNRYHSSARTVLTLVKQGRLSAARTLYLGKVAALNDRVTADLASLIQLNTRQARDLDRQISNASDTGRKVTIALLVIALLVSGLIGYL